MGGDIGIDTNTIDDYHCGSCANEEIVSHLFLVDDEWWCPYHGQVKWFLSGGRMALYAIKRWSLEYTTYGRNVYENELKRRLKMSDEFVIEQAELTKSKAKILFVGPTGAGKTYTALVTAHELGEKILVIDTENKTSVKFAKQMPFRYDVLALTKPYSLDRYYRSMDFALQKGYDVVIVDSMSHAWTGEGGALEEVNQTTASSTNHNKFTSGWSVVTPKQNRLTSMIQDYPVHLISTARMKMDYVLTVDDKGKQAPQKVGMGIVQRDNFEYEYDIVVEGNIDHWFKVTKTRCFELDGYVKQKPDGELGQIIANWLNTGEPVKYFSSLDDLLMQVQVDFGFDSDQAKAEFKKTGITGIPHDPVEKRRRLTYAYNKIKENVNGQEETVDEVAF